MATHIVLRCFDLGKAWKTRSLGMGKIHGKPPHGKVRELTRAASADIDLNRPSFREMAGESHVHSSETALFGIIAAACFTLMIGL